MRVSLPVSVLSVFTLAIVLVISESPPAIATQLAAQATLDPGIATFVSSYCTRCHDQERAKGGLNLTELLERDDLTGDLIDWRLVRERIRHREMPPPESRTSNSPYPDEGVIDSVLRTLDLTLATTVAALPQEPGAITVRRLSRRELGATILDLTGVALDIEELLPPDDVGDGFDHIGDVLSLPPMLFEKWVGIAEEVARDAVLLPGEARIPLRRVGADDLGREGGGRLVPGRYQHLFSYGTIFLSHRFPLSGTYRITSEVFGQQAGDDVVKFALDVAGERRTVLEVPAVARAPGSYELELKVTRGMHKVALTFINDYYRPNHPDPKERDRNAAVVSITVEGPLEGLEPTAFQRALLPVEPAPADWRRSLAAVLPDLLRRTWRRPATEEQVVSLLDLVGRATPEGSSASEHLRTALVVALISPRFLFRLEHETDGAPGSVRNLDGYERATRLSYFLHGTPPDPRLLDAALAGELDTAAGVRAHALRLLSRTPASGLEVATVATPPTARSLSEAFVPQWLQFAHLPQHRPDPKLFPAVDEDLMRDLHRETTELFDHVLRDARPVWELIDGGYSWLNGRLARYYGIEGVTGPTWRQVEINNPRGGGLLAQGSILTATSSPTRTSPVMRGKWVLETLLDAPPPPAPPGAGTLPEVGQPGSELTLRQQLEAHRRDPRCASCHVRMDALGFALEEFDAVGAWRRTDAENEIDCRGTLPDGRVVEGVNDLRAVLVGDRGFLRALAKNLCVFALGRGLTLEDEPALERLIARLEVEPTIPALIDEIVGLEAFLRRRVPLPETADSEREPSNPTNERELR